MKWKLSIVQEVDDDPIFQMENWGTDMPYHRLKTWLAAESELEAGGTWLLHTCQWNDRNNVGPAALPVFHLILWQAELWNLETPCKVGVAHLFYNGKLVRSTWGAVIYGSILRLRNVDYVET